MSGFCPNPRLLKVHRTYTIEELADRLHVHKNTVLAWRRAGLAPIDDRKPMVFHGAMVATFLNERRAKAKHPCPPGFIYCMKCRLPRRPDGDTADYIPLTASSGNLAALCPVCGGMMYRRIRRADIAALFGNLEVTFAEAMPRIKGWFSPFRQESLQEWNLNMKTINPQNERIKRTYFAYLKEAKRNGEQSVDTAAMALDRFEDYTRRRDFKLFHPEQAIGFKKYLGAETNARTKAPLSKATVHAILAALRAFFFWLAGQPGFKSRLAYSDADYFNLSAKDLAVAKAVRERPVPTIEQIKHVLRVMPANDEIAMRNRALIAFTLLTGARDRAIASLRLKHVDVETGEVFQDAREVRTKFSKTFSTFFFPIGDDVRAIVSDWVDYLRRVKLWGLDDPLFPSTQVAVVDGRFTVAGLKREPWNNTTAIREIFREAFAAAGLPYFNPHSFRKTLARLGEQICRTPEEFKAWSQNLGHEKVQTTFSSYGDVAPHRQRELVESLAKPRAADPDVLQRIRQIIDQQPAATIDARSV